MLHLKSVLVFLLLISLLSCKEKKDIFYMPGEFEPQEAVWLGWQGYEPYYEVNTEMVRALMPYVKIKIVSESDSISHISRSYLAAKNIDTSLINFFVIPDNEFWIRDHGATYIKNGKGASKVVDFEWVTYGYKQWLMDKYNNDSARVEKIFSASRAGKRGQVDSLMAVKENIPVIKSWIKIEGGAIEVNGKGTLILNEQLTLQRNPGFSKEEIIKEFNRVLGTTNIIWLKHGLAEDPHIWQAITGKYVGMGTGGHTDEFVRFADENTILLAWVPEEEKDKNPLNRMNYERMKANYEILANAKNENGEAFNIIKVPLPELIIKEVKISEPQKWDSSLNIPVSVFKEGNGWKPGDTAYRVAASSYLNYYVTNGMVLLPTYIKMGTSGKKENEVKAIMSKAFPGRELVFIDAMTLNWQGGGIHCGTQQQPRL